MAILVTLPPLLLIGTRDPLARRPGRDYSRSRRRLKWIPPPSRYEGVFLFGGLAYLGAALRERHGISYALIGALLAGFGVGGLAYSRLVGRLVRRLGERRLILVGGGLSAACYLALVPRGWWQLFGPLALVFGLAFNLLHGTLQTKATELAPTARATAVSLFAFSLFLGQGAGAALLGTIVDSGGYGPTFAVAGLATWLLALWLAWAVRRQARR